MKTWIARWPVRWLLPVLLALGVWFALGWQVVQPEGYTVRDSSWLRVTPMRLAPGVHWVAPLLMTTRVLPQEPEYSRFVLGMDPDRVFLSPEGARWAGSGVIAWQVEEEDLQQVVAAVGDQVFLRLVLPALADAFGQLVRDGKVSGQGSGEEGLRRILTPRLAAGGVRLVGLGLDVAGPPERVDLLTGERSARAEPPNRVLLVGWDGADWNIIDPLLQSGRLPHLQALLEAGVRRRLRTVMPVLSPVVWTSMATGTLPEKHGIIDFLALDPATGARVPVTSNLRRVPALWTLLARRALPVGVVAWWATWPAEEITGYMITDRVAYQLFGLGDAPGQGWEGKTWPPELHEEIAPLVVQPRDVLVGELAAFSADLAGNQPLPAEDAELLDSLRTVVAATRTYHRIALHQAARQTTTLQAVYYEATDTAAHLFMPFATPAMEGIPPRREQLWGRAVDAAYTDLDTRLGELIAAAGPDTTVILASDHGFRTGDNRPAGSSRIGEGRAAEWHRKYGILVMAGPAIRTAGTSGDASVLDIAPTVLALLGLPVPDQMDGSVLLDDLDPDFLRRFPPLVQGLEPTPGPAPDAPVASADDQAIVERLRSLGYVGVDDVADLTQDDATGFNNRAALFLAAGDGEAALRETDQGLNLVPDSSSLLTNRARALRLLKRDEEALQILLGVLEKHPDLAPVENLVGNIYMERGELDAAARHFNQALALDPNAADVLISRGLLSERQGGLDAALKDFHRASLIDPDSAEAHNNIGNVHRRQALQAAARGEKETAAQAFGKAEAAYRAGMKADAEFVGSYNNLALIYQETGRPEAAMALYQRALEKEPDQAVVHNNLGSLYFASGRLEEARDSFAAAIAADESYAAAWNNLGAARGVLGDAEGELAAYRKAVELDPDYADGFHNLGLALMQRHDPEGAETALLRALDLQVDYISARMALGDLYRSTGRWQDAINMLQEALAVNTRLPDVHNRLAEIWLEQGNRQEARAAWRRSLELDSAQPHVRQRLDQLPE